MQVESICRTFVLGMLHSHVDVSWGRDRGRWFKVKSSAKFSRPLANLCGKSLSNNANIANIYGRDSHKPCYSTAKP